MLLPLLTACGGGGGGGGGAGTGTADGGAISGLVVDGPVSGALVVCATLDAAGTPSVPVLGQAVSDAGGGYQIGVSKAHAGPILCNTVGGQSAEIPAPQLAVVVPDDIALDQQVSAHINPLTTIVYNRLRAAGDFSPSAIRWAYAALADSLGMGWELWLAIYGGDRANDVALTGFLNGFHASVTRLQAQTGDAVTAAENLMAALDRDTADGTLDGQDNMGPILVEGTPLAEVSPELISPGGGSPANQPPTADAGADWAAIVGALVALDGSGSSDPDGDPISYLWSVTGQPVGGGAELSDTTLQVPTFTPQAVGVYTFSLTVNDGLENSTPDLIQVTVSLTPVTNQPPVANAGADLAGTVGDIIRLDGSGSFDPDGDLISYLWSVTSAPLGATPQLSFADARQPTFSGDLDGTYILSLVTNDGQVDSTPNTMLVTLSPVPNGAPVADAGTDQAVTTGDTVTLDGSLSRDGELDPLTYAWTLDSQPVGGTAALSNPTAIKPTFVADLAGVYNVSLVVNDGLIDSLPSTVTVTATDPPNLPPTANAGLDLEVTSQTTVVLDGGGSSDPEGGALSYAWAMVSQPVGTAAVLSTNAGQQTSFTPDLAGTYLTTLTVTDNAGATAADQVAVVVAAPASGTSVYTFIGQAANDWFGYALTGPGDVNGDGTPDLAVGAFHNGNGTGQVRVFSGADSTLLYGLTGDAPGDLFGQTLSPAGDTNGDGLMDLLVGAPGASTTLTRAGLVRVIRGTDAIVLHSFDGDADSDALGSSVAPAGDMNGDGFDDVMAGAPTANNNTGYVKVFSGFDGSVLHTLTGPVAGGRFGASVAGSVDLNGDLTPDIVVGAPGNGTLGINSGTVLVYSGATGLVLYQVDGDTLYTNFGHVVSLLGDIDFDGVSDLAVGTPNHSQIVPNGGQVKVLSGVDGTLIYSLEGTTSSDQFGFSVAATGDVNGDGYGDMVVGIPGDDTATVGAGRAEVYGGISGAYLFAVDGDAPYDGLGRAVSGVGDINGDGYADVAVGVPGNDVGGAEAGQAKVVLGGP